MPLLDNVLGGWYRSSSQNSLLNEITVALSPTQDCIAFSSTTEASHQELLVTFLVAGTKYLKRSHLREEGLTLVHSLRRDTVICCREGMAMGA